MKIAHHAQGEEEFRAQFLLRPVIIVTHQITLSLSEEKGILVKGDPGQKIRRIQISDLSEPSTFDFRFLDVRWGLQRRYAAGDLFYPNNLNHLSIALDDRGEREFVIRFRNNTVCVSIINLAVSFSLEEK